MDSSVNSDLVPNSAQTKIKSMQKITAPYNPIKKITDDDEVMRKRKLRFADNAVPESNALVSKKEASDILGRRRMRFNGENSAKKYSMNKSNEDLLSTLKKRRERFGEVTSTLLKSIEEKEKVLKRKSRFGLSKLIKKNGENMKKLEFDQKVDANACEITINQEVKERKVLKKITFEDSVFSLTGNN